MTRVHRTIAEHPVGDVNTGGVRVLRLAKVHRSESRPGAPAAPSNSLSGRWRTLGRSAPSRLFASPALTARDGVPVWPAMADVEAGPAAEFVEANAAEEPVAPDAPVEGVVPRATAEEVTATPKPSITSCPPNPWITSAPRVPVILSGPLVPTCVARTLAQVNLVFEARLGPKFQSLNSVVRTATRRVPTVTGLRLRDTWIGNSTRGMRAIRDRQTIAEHLQVARRRRSRSATRQART